jgi:hypothetical protein
MTILLPVPMSRDVNDNKTKAFLRLKIHFVSIAIYFGVAESETIWK